MKRVAALLLIFIAGCGGSPTAQECQEARDQQEMEGWPQAMIQGSFESCREDYLQGR